MVINYYSRSNIFYLGASLLCDNFIHFKTYQLKYTTNIHNYYTHPKIHAHVCTFFYAHVCRIRWFFYQYIGLKIRSIWSFPIRRHISSAIGLHSEPISKSTPTGGESVVLNTERAEVFNLPLLMFLYM